MPKNTIKKSKLVHVILHESQKTISQIHNEQQKRKIELLKTQIENEKLIQEFHQLMTDMERMKNQIAIDTAGKKQVEEEKLQQNDPSAQIRSLREFDQQHQLAELRNNQDREKLHQKMMDQIQFYQQSIDEHRENIKLIGNEIKQLNMEKTTLVRNEAKVQVRLSQREEKLAKLEQEIHESEKEYSHETTDESNIFADILGQELISEAHMDRVERLKEKSLKIQKNLVLDREDLDTIRQSIADLSLKDTALLDALKGMQSLVHDTVLAMDRLKNIQHNGRSLNSMIQRDRSITKKDLQPGVLTSLASTSANEKHKKGEEATSTMKSGNVGPGV